MVDWRALFLAANHSTNHGRTGVADGNGGWQIKVNVTEDLDKIADGFGIPRSDVSISSMGRGREIVRIFPFTVI